MTERFKKKQDCYLDTTTNLEWSLNNFGPLPWKEAIRICDVLKEGWRLPSIEELLILIDHSIYNPATNLPGMVSFGYWSFTTYTQYPGYAGNVYFYYGSGDWDHVSHNHYVRAVRGGKDD